MKPCAVYRCFDADGRLLYVGMTGRSLPFCMFTFKGAK
jgi:hypothetical protein